MSKLIWIIPLTLLLCLGCADDEPEYSEEELAQIPQPVRTGLPQPSGGFTLAVGRETITADDIVEPLLPRMQQAAQTMTFEQFASQAMPAVAMTLRDKIADILLYQQAKKAAPEEIDDQLDKAVEAEMRKFLGSFDGNYAKAEQFLKNYHGMDWKQFREYQRRMILSSSYLQGRLEEETPVTHSEIRNYYSQNIDRYRKDPAITIRLIDLDISQTEPDPNSSARQTALSLAQEIMRRLNAGEDFASLAEQFSHGYRAAKGGLWQPVKPQSLAEPYDILAEKAEDMTVGDITGPIKAGDHIFIMKLEDKQSGDVTPLEDVQAQIEQEIKMQRKREDFEKVMSRVMEEAAISGIDEFAVFCVREIYRRANAR